MPSSNAYDYIIVVTSSESLTKIQDLKLEGKKVLVAVIVPGVDTGQFIESNSYDFYSIDEQQDFSQAYISKHAVNFVDEVIDPMVQSINLDEITKRHIVSLKNMYAFYAHILATVVVYLEFLAQKNTDSKFIFFGSNLSFKFPERIEIRKLFYMDDFLSPILFSFFKEHDIRYTNIQIRPRYWVKSVMIFRSSALTGYKFMIISFRWFKEYFAFNPKMKLNQNVIMVRGASEVWSIKSILEIFDKNNRPYTILQDDLLNNPSSKKALVEENLDFCNIHKFISFYTLCKLFILGLRVAKKVKNHMLSSTPDVFISKTRMLKIVAPELIFSCLKNMPQLMIHKQELENCLNKDVKSFLTLDMVDQWAATQGLVCKDKGIKSYTLQNTSLDDIVYPIPVSTDYFLASTASDKVKLNPCKNVIVIGIPMYDHLEELISLKDKEYENFARKYKLVERYENIVLFIPQPFIQDYPYNEKLIKDSLEAFKGESVLVIIKVHPRQKCSEFQQYKILLEELNIKCIVISKGDFNQVALISDIGISRTSTALQTLIYFNKKIVAYLDNYPSDIVERLSYLNNEYIYKCNSQKSYIKTLQLLLKGVSKEENKILNKEKEKYLEQTIGYFDGLSSQRAYNEITKL